MHRLNELAEKLTPSQVREVEDFAEFLISRDGNGANARPISPQDHKISFEGWAGCLAGVRPELSDKEFEREANEELAAKYEEYLK